ncbi:hypothetical protein SprV_0902766700 [Sparganum proliferum]
MGRTVVADYGPTQTISNQRQCYRLGTLQAELAAAGGALTGDGNSPWTPTSPSMEESCLQSPHCRLLLGDALLSGFAYPTPPRAPLSIPTRPCEDWPDCSRSVAALTLFEFSKTRVDRRKRSDNTTSSSSRSDQVALCGNVSQGGGRHHERRVRLRRPTTQKAGEALSTSKNNVEEDAEEDTPVNSDPTRRTFLSVNTGNSNGVGEANQPPNVNPDAASAARAGTSMVGSSGQDGVDPSSGNLQEPRESAASPMDVIRHRLNTLATEMRSDNAELSAMLRNTAALANGAAAVDRASYAQQSQMPPALGGMTELRRSLKTLVDEMRNENQQLESAMLASYIEAQKQAAAPNPAEQMLVRALNELKTCVQTLAGEFSELIQRQNSRVDEVPNLRAQASPSEVTHSALTAILSGLNTEGQPASIARGPSGIMDNGVVLTDGQVGSSQLQPTDFDAARLSSPSFAYKQSVATTNPVNRSFSQGSLAQQPMHSVVGGSVAYQPSLALGSNKQSIAPTYPVNRSFIQNSLAQQSSIHPAKSVIGGPAAYQPSQALGRSMMQSINPSGLQHSIIDPNRPTISQSDGRPISSIGLEALSRPSAMPMDLPNRGTQTFFGGRTTTDGLGTEASEVRVDPIESYLRYQKEPSIITSEADEPPSVEVIAAPADPEIMRALEDLRSRIVAMGKEVMTEPPPPPPPEKPRTPPVDPTIIHALEGIRDSIKSMARAPSTDSTYERTRNEEFTNVLKEIRKSLQSLEEEQKKAQAPPPPPPPPVTMGPGQPGGYPFYPQAPRLPQPPLPGQNGAPLGAALGTRPSSNENTGPIEGTASLASSPLPVPMPLPAQQTGGQPPSAVMIPGQGQGGWQRPPYYGMYDDDGGCCEDCCCCDDDYDYYDEYDDDDEDYDEDAEEEDGEKEEDKDRYHGGHRRRRGRHRRVKDEAKKGEEKETDKPPNDEKSCKYLQRLLDMLDRCTDGPGGEGGGEQPPAGTTAPGTMPSMGYWRPFPGLPPTPFYPGGLPIAPRWCPPPPTCPPPYAAAMSSQCLSHTDSCSCGNSGAGLPPGSNFYCTRVDK